MDILKCNLYIVGNPGVGKTSLRKMIAEFIRTDKTSHSDIFAGPDWKINTEYLSIEIEIKENRSLDLSSTKLISKATKSIIVYITHFNANKPAFISQKEVEQLKSLSKKSTIIIVSTFGQVKLERKNNFSALKKALPFVEYFIPINDYRLSEYDNPYQFGPLLRQIIINLHPASLKYAKELIKQNFETRDPTLDLGNCGLTSLYDIKELFENTHLKKLILSNEWGEYVNGTWERKISNNKLGANTLFKLPSGLGRLKKLETLIAGGNWKNSKRRTRYFSGNWFITDLRVLSQSYNLSVLNLSNNEISSFTPLKYLSNLTKLYLNNNSATNFPVTKSFPKLKELYLSNNFIRNTDFLSHGSNIQTVDLHSNRIGDLTPIKNLISKIGIRDSKWENRTISIANNPLTIPLQRSLLKEKEVCWHTFLNLKLKKI